MATITIVYSTYNTAQKAQEVLSILLNERLVACGVFAPVTSCYHWQGQNVQDAEWALWLKTKNENKQKVEQRITELHNYKIPCILSLSVQANDKYAAWVAEQTS